MLLAHRSVSPYPAHTPGSSPTVTMPLSEPASWVLPSGMQDDAPPQASLLPASPRIAFDNHGPSRSGSKATSHKAAPDPPRGNQPHSPVILKQGGPTCVFLVLVLWQWFLSSLLLPTGTLPCSLSHISDKPKALRTAATAHFTSKNKRPTHPLNNIQRKVTGESIYKQKIHNHKRLTAPTDHQERRKINHWGNGQKI